MSASVGLLSFYIFNSKLSSKEGDEYKKIIYYYPKSDPLDTRLRNIGLSEAIIKFTETFSPNKPCESVHTQKTRQLYHNVEKDFWLVLTLSIPSQPKTKDGHSYVEYYSEEVQDHVYEAQLILIYRMFKLLFGTFEFILKNNENEIEALKKRLKLFVNWYISKIKFSQLDILDVFQGIHFLPLERLTFLKIQCFLNLLESKFKEILYTAFLFHDQLVSSGLKQEDNQILFHYLTSSLLPTFLEQELQGLCLTSSKSQAKSGRFSYMTLPQKITEVDSFEKLPKIYVNCDGEHCEKCFLVIYRAFCSTLVLLIDSTASLSLEFFETLDDYLNPLLNSLSNEIGEQYEKSASADQQNKYFYAYFNQINLAQKSALYQDSKKLISSALITPDQMKLLSDFHLDLTQIGYGEIIGKTVQDSWIVGKLENQRELFLVMQQKNANIVEVQQEMKKINASLFQNTFILD